MAIHPVPLEIIEIHPDGVHCLVRAILAGEEINLVVDTGASRTVFDMDVVSDLLGADSLEIAPEPSTAIGVSTLTSYFVQIPGLSIGEMHLPEFQGVAMDLSNILDSYRILGLPDIAGILGGDILLTTNAAINYGDSTMYLNDDFLSSL